MQGPAVSMEGLCCLAGSEKIAVGRVTLDAHFALLHNIIPPSTLRHGCLPYAAWTFLEGRPVPRHAGRQASLAKEYLWPHSVLADAACFAYL